MKSKPSVCPVCGGRLFLESSKGKQCATCGHVLGEEKTSSLAREIPSKNPIQGDAAPTAVCPNCGSVASFSFSDESGDFYSCKMCGATFQKQEKPAPSTLPTPKPKPKPLVKDENAPKDGAEIFKIAKECTLELRKWLVTKKGYTSGSSGFYITPEVILTCSHCVIDGKPYQEGSKGKHRDDCKLEARYKGGNYFPVTLLYYDADHDLALVKASKRCLKPAKIAKKNAETGEAIFSVGNTQNEGTCIMQGIVADESRIITSVGGVKREMMMNTANTMGGNSGCPTFNDKGEVVGVHTAGDTKNVAMKYDAPVERIRRFLSAAEAKLGIKLAD